MTALIEPETTTTAPPRPEPRVRGAIAVLLSKFPKVEEPYILREMIELERCGQPIFLVALRKAPGKVMHEEAKPWLRRVFYTRSRSFAVIGANLFRLLTQPRRYLRVLFRIIAGTLIDPAVLVRTLAVFPKAVYLASALPKHGIRHIHAHFATEPAAVAYVISSLSDVTYSFSVHGPDVFVHRMLMREKMRAATFVRTVSLFNKAFLTGLYPSVAHGKLEMLHTGVNPETYQNAGPREAKHRLRIVSVAKLSPTKSFPLLVDACGRLERDGYDFELLIAGSGETRIEIEEAIAQHDVADRVRLLGALPQHEVAELLASADIFVLPSVISQDGQMDGIPVALMEAMASGLPVVAAPISGIPELVEDGRSGLVIDATHPARIADALRRLMDDPELRRTMGAVGREKVRREFDIRHNTAKLIEMMERHEVVEPAVPKLQLVFDLDKLGAAAMGVRRVHERYASIIGEVCVTDGITSREVVIKRHCGPDLETRTAVQCAQDEFSVLEMLHKRLPALQDPERIGYWVPKPLMVDEENGAFAMERADGRPLEDLVRKARNRGFVKRRLALPLKRAATWLRLMQSVTRSDEDGRHVLTALVVLALRDLNLAAAADRVVRRHHAEIALTLQKLEARVAERPLPVVGHHSDFWTGNIFISDKRVEVIDFEGYREGLPLEDVAYFMINLGLYFVYPGFGRELPALKRIFLDAYSEGGTVDPDGLRLMLIAKVLQRIAHGGEGERSRKMWRRRALRRVLLDALEDGGDNAA